MSATNGNGTSTAAWLRNQEGTEREITLSGHTFRIRAIGLSELAARGVEIPAVAGGAARRQVMDAAWARELREVVTLGLVSPKVWEGKPDDCPDDCVLYADIAKRNLDPQIYLAILDLTGYTAEVKQAVSFRDVPETGGEGGEAGETVGAAADGDSTASGG